MYSHSNKENACKELVIHITCYFSDFDSHFCLIFEIYYLKYFAGPFCVYNVSLSSGLWSSTLILSVSNSLQMNSGLSWRLGVAVKDENPQEPIIPSPSCCLTRKIFSGVISDKVHDEF